MENPKDWPGDDPEAALKQLYNLNYPWLENYIRQNSGTEEDARDIFQEGLIAAWINLKEGRFSGQTDAFSAYLRQICKYKWISQIRSAARKRMQYTEDVSVFEQAAEHTAVTEDQLLEGQLLKSSFAALGEKCRTVLGQFYYQRKSLAEIAAAQGNTEESIKTIKYRCMMQLRKIYLEKHKGNGEV